MLAFPKCRGYNKEKGGIFVRNTRKTMKTISIIFLLVGVVLGSVGVAIGIIGSRWEQSLVPVNGWISHITTEWDSTNGQDHHVYVGYVYEGVTHEDVPISVYKSSMDPGDRIRLGIDPEKPDSATMLGSFRLFGSIMGGIGAVFALIGLIFPGITAANKRKAQKLMENGRRIHAMVSNVEMNFNVTINGRHPYVLYCRDGQRNYKSSFLWEDPSDRFPVGTYVSVYVDPERPDRYYVDTRNAESVGEV